MSMFRSIAVIAVWVGCSLLPGSILLASQPLPANSDLTIAVADFSGPDRQMGRFLADSLLTDLAQSDRLRLTERSEIRHALTEIRLQATGLAEEPREVKKVGRLIGADRLIVGGYMLHNETVLVNARLLDVRTGRVVQGSAANVSGSINDELTVIHRLARLVHRRITGVDLLLVDERPLEVSGAEMRAAGTADRDRADPPPTDPPRAELASAHTRSNDPVTEQDIAGLVHRLAAQDSMLTDLPFQIERPSAPVTRIRALGALVKARCTRSDLEEARGLRLASAPVDMARVPRWAQPYAAISVDRGWWPADRLLRPAETATWAFVDALVGQMFGDGSAPPGEARPPAPVLQPEAAACTGLIVEADGLVVERAMSVRILDVDGNVLYPDAKHLPPDDYLQDYGMVSYIHRGDAAERAGARPMVVKAISTASYGSADLVVDTAIGRRILAENRRGRFIARWKVCVVVDEGR